MKAAWYRPLQKALRAATYLVAHAGLALLMVGLISLVQWALNRDGDPKLFDVLPLRYIFDAIDLLILATFMIFGTAEAVQVFREADDD